MKALMDCDLDDPKNPKSLIIRKAFLPCFSNMHQNEVPAYAEFMDQATNYTLTFGIKKLLEQELRCSPSTTFEIDVIDRQAYEAYSHHLLRRLQTLVQSMTKEHLKKAADVSIGSVLFDYYKCAKHTITEIERKEMELIDSSLSREMVTKLKFLTAYQYV